MGTGNGDVCGSQGETNQHPEFGINVPDSKFLDMAQSFAKMWEGKKKVMICEPSVGMIDFQAHESACDMMFSLARYEAQSEYKFFKSCLGRMLIQYSREMFAEYAVNVGFDYIFYIDDDHLWHPDTFQVLEKYIKEYDIVAPMCCQRSKPYNPVIYKSEFRVENGQNIFHNRLYCEGKKITKGDVISDADAIGFGCAIVKVDLFKKIPRPWFMSMSAIGEDILFCMKAKQFAGAKILVDTGIEAPHLKNRESVCFEDYLKEIATK